MNRHSLKRLSIAGACFVLLVAVPSFSLSGVAQTVNTASQSPQVQSSGGDAQSKAAAAPIAGASSSSILINDGDLVEVSVFGVPELGQRARVDSEGRIYLPLLGYVKVGGKTAGAAQTFIEKSLEDGGFVRSPHVTVYVAESTLGITIFGEVAHPGMFSPNTTRTLMDLITVAGGFTQTAGNNIILANRDGGEPKKITWNNESEKMAALSEPVRQGDTVTVTKAAMVYVVGEVVSPSGYIYDQNRRMTVLQAVAMSRGLTKDAATGSARLVRRTPTGIVEVQVPLKQILQSKASDITLEPEDILFVPTSTGKIAARRSIDMIMAMTGAIAIRSW